MRAVRNDLMGGTLVFAYCYRFLFAPVANVTFCQGITDQCEDCVYLRCDSGRKTGRSVTHTVYGDGALQ